MLEKAQGKRKDMEVNLKMKKITRLRPARTFIFKPLRGAS